jgi:lipopolysaccharide transport system ATP-binding protein
MTPILEVKNVSKKFRIGHAQEPYLSLRERVYDIFRFNGAQQEDFWALTDVSFDVTPGLSLGIIGKNGAGKSTLLKILSKITPPTSGKIITRGRVASLLEVGTGFHSELTGRENVFFNGSLLGMKRKEIAAKFDEIIDFSGTEKFLDTPLKHYSSGMQLRLAFAVAAFLEPEILVIDEVLAVGDAEFQKKCLGKMEDVSKSGRTILFVSHNMTAVKHLCSHCVYMESGKLVTMDTTDKVINSYLSTVVEDRSVSGTFERPSNASAWVERIRLNSARHPLEYGDRVVIEVTFRSIEPIQPCIGFVLSSMNGVQLLNTNNRYQNSSVITEPLKEGVIVCDLGAVPLMQGNYVISFYFGDTTGDEHIVENALTFTVDEKDVWGKGKLPPANVSEMWWPTQFTISV